MLKNQAKTKKKPVHKVLLERLQFLFNEEFWHIAQDPMSQGKRIDATINWVLDVRITCEIISQIKFTASAHIEVLAEMRKRMILAESIYAQTIDHVLDVREPIRLAVESLEADEN